MFLSAVSLVLAKLILTNKDGHFECFSLMKPNIRTYLESIMNRDTGIDSLTLRAKPQGVGQRIQKPLPPNLLRGKRNRGGQGIKPEVPVWSWALMDRRKTMTGPRSSSG